MASAQLVLTTPNFTVCEFHGHDVPFFAELCSTPIDEWFTHGWVTPTDRPGFGIELNESVGKKYRFAGSRWFDER
jgi:L-alanine-DL-glutamate epimerase-like enolase superfamily enzyme